MPAARVCGDRERFFGLKGEENENYASLNCAMIMVVLVWNHGRDCYRRAHLRDRVAAALSEADVAAMTLRRGLADDGTADPRTLRSLRAHAQLL
ncbi:MAG TPA: hypothetical protein VK993_15525 [Chthoniobacterales bacterium]|nr:hypothetical protein [Chthoniobacterales bacterium]